MGIMLTKDCFVKLHHFHTGYAQAAALKAVYNLTYQLALNTAGFEQYEGCFHYILYIRCIIFSFGNYYTFSVQM